MKTMRAWQPLLLCLMAGFKTQAQSTNDFPELIPPYAELPPTFWEQHGLTVLFASLAFALVAGIVIWLILRPKPVQLLPPEVQARCALEALHMQPESGTLLSQVSQILRRYIIAAFGLSAGELTTSELISAMESSRQLDDKLRHAARQFLESCDARKFASASSAQTQNTVSLALALVEQGEILRAGSSSTSAKSSA